VRELPLPGNARLFCVGRAGVGRGAYWPYGVGTGAGWMCEWARYVVAGTRSWRRLLSLMAKVAEGVLIALALRKVPPQRWN
jgi:hypothetical protein